MTRFLKKYYPSLLVAALITWLSLTNTNNINPGRWFNFPNSDKLAHFLIYGFFALMLLLDSSNWKISGKVQYLILLVPVFMGILMEALQYLLTDYRSADLLDFAANITGIACAALFIIMLRRFYRKKVLD